MIDRESFATMMAIFAERIGRPLAPASAQMYHDILSRELTTEEFLAGARVVFRNHTINTWPAPIEFIEAVKPATLTPLVDAGMAFEKLLTFACDHYADATEVERKVREMGTVAAFAYRAAGGRAVFRDLLQTDEPFVRRRFETLYCEQAAAVARDEDARVALDEVDPKARTLIKKVAQALDAKRKRLPPEAGTG